MIGYHVISKHNLRSILRNGLIPQRGKSTSIANDRQGIYLFDSIESAESAMMNWLGDEIENWENENKKDYDEIVLTIDLSGLENYIESDVDYEFRVTTTIHPDRIIKTGNI